MKTILKNSGMQSGWLQLRYYIHTLDTGNTNKIVSKVLPSREKTNPINVNGCPVIEISQIKKTSL
jgi:hypothetical protein